MHLGTSPAWVAVWRLPQVTTHHQPALRTTSDEFPRPQFLPITETRFKRKKGDEPPNPIGVGLPLSKASGDSLSSVHNPASPLYNHPAAAGQTSPYTAGLAGSIAGSSPDTPGGSSLRKEARIVGPTSISHLMHSTSTFPHERMGPVDDKYAQSLTVDETGDGFIRILSTGDGDPLGRGGSEHVAIQGIERADAEKLLNFFFSTHAEHFPVVSKADFLSTASPTPLLFNALCGISALSHHVAPAILRTIKGTIRATMRDEDVLDNSSISNIQSLLVYAMSMELEKGTAASKTWNLLGVAIRMAQDLGLHRKMGSEGSAQSQSDHTELRRRVWGGCVIADRWAAAVYGQPMMIDLADCDCQLPSAFDIKRPGLELDTEENRRPFLFNSALVDLSILLGRILKAVYSPTGILNLSAEDGQGLIDALERWLVELPEELKFKGPDKSSSAAGFLHLLYIPVRFLVTRPFMRISFQLPEKFANISVGTQSWAVVEKEAREAIEWVDRNESCLEGWFMGIYAHFLCSLIQYHSHIRKRDTTSLATLRLARDTLKRLVVPDGECHVRAKIAEIAHLLYHTAGTVSKWAPDSASGTISPVATDAGAATLPPLNPTVGVRQREQDWHAKYRKGVAARQAASGAVPPSIPAYANSLRTTHEEEPAKAEPQADAAPTVNGTGGADGAVDGVDQLAANLLPGLTSEALPPVSGFDFGAGGGEFDGAFNFNPNLNFGAVPGMGGMFDTFGLGGEGAPQLDGILDWGTLLLFSSGDGVCCC